MGLDILSLIISNSIWDNTKEEILALILAGPTLHGLYLPYIYRHLHLSDLDDSINCLETLSRDTSLCYQVRTVAISVDIHSTIATRHHELQRFRALLVLVLPRAGKLTSLNIMYYHDDEDSLIRWTDTGIQSALPDSIKIISFLPVGFDGWDAHHAVGSLNICLSFN